MSGVLSPETVKAALKLAGLIETEMSRFIFTYMMTMMIMITIMKIKIMIFMTM